MSLKPLSIGLDAMLELARQAAEMPPESRTCDTHGEYQSRTRGLNRDNSPAWSPCPTCAAIAHEKAEADRRDREAVAQQARLEAAFRRSGIPERFVGKTFANYLADTKQKARALNAAKRFADSDDTGLSMIFCGKPGTGKTHLACAIAADRIAARQSVMFITALAAVRHVRATYRKDAELSEVQAIASLCDPGLLILDEIGIQHGTEHEKMILFDVINDRYANCLGTVLLSNLNADDLREYLGERIMDRFRESGVVLAFDWESHRGKRAA